MIKLSTQHKACETFLVAAFNAAIEQGHMTVRCEPVPTVVFEFTLDNGCPVVVHIRDVGFVGHVEVQLQAILDPTEAGREYIRHGVSLRQNKHRRSYGTAIVSGILERGKGIYLQDWSRAYYGTRYVTECLAALKVKPLGFAAHPPRVEVR